MAERVVKVRLTAQIAEYERAFKQAAEVTRMTRAEAEKLSKQEKQAAQDAVDLGRRKREAFDAFGKSLVVVGGAMTAVGVAVARTGIAYNTLQQTTRAALTTMLGSAQAANAQMDKLDAFARTSPFAKQVFITAQQQMLSFGIETQKVVPYLDAIQDAVAASGGGNQQVAELAFIMAQISSAAKITGQDLLQFGQRGVNAAELIGSRMGMTGAQVRDAITAGTLDADAALDALAEGMKTKFNGAAANVKETFEGAMDRVKGAWRDVSAELMRPFVDPNGGGMLVDFLNWTADIMRAFQRLPEPVKYASGLLFGLIGMVTLVGGTALLAIPKLLAFKAQMSEIGITGDRVRGGLMGFVRFLGGPWGIALLAATTAAQAFNAVLAESKASAEEVNAAYTSAGRTVESMWATTGKGRAELGLMGAELGKLQETIDYLNGSDVHYFSYFLAADDVRNTGDRLIEVGKTLADLARSDLPAAQGAFREFAAYTDGTDESVWRLIQALGGEFKSQLIAVATEAGTYSEEMSEAKKQTALVEAAMTDLVPAADGTSDAVGETASQVYVLKDAAHDVEKTLAIMKSRLDEVGGSAMTAGELIDRAQGSINSLVDAIEAEGASLSGTNDESIKLRDSLREVEQRHRDAAVAIAENGGALAESTAQYDAGREAIYQQLEAMGLSRDEAVAWAEAQLGASADVVAALADVHRGVDDIPGNKDISLSLTGVDAFNAAMDFATRDRTIAVTTMLDAANTMFGALPNYRGGLYDDGKVKAFYQGGFASGVYRGVPGGIHKFAESEMGVPWEAYISGRAADRERNQGVWVETGYRLGMLGAGSSSGTGSGQRPIEVNQTINGVPGMSPEQVAQIASERMSYALRG